MTAHFETVARVAALGSWTNEGDRVRAAGIPIPTPAVPLKASENELSPRPKSAGRAVP